MVEIGRRICQLVVGRRSEIVGRRVVDAGLADGGITAAGFAIAVVVGADPDAGWAIVAVAAVVAVRAVVAIAAVAHVIDCALVVACRFALRRLVEC